MLEPTELFSAFTGWRIGRGCPLDGRLSNHNTESLTVDYIVGNVFVDCHEPCTFKDLFCKFPQKKELSIVAATRDHIVRPYPNLHTFPVAVKTRCSSWPIPPLLLYRSSGAGTAYPSGAHVFTPGC